MYGANKNAYLMLLQDCHKAVGSVTSDRDDFVFAVNYMIKSAGKCSFQMAKKTSDR